MEYNSAQLLQEIDNALKRLKESELYLERVEKDNYLKTKLAQLKYDFAREEYLRLLKIARDEHIKYDMQDLYEKIIDV
ncbi:MULTISPECIES: hypothetical protein [Thermoanaerobacterium]|uniref:DUF2508 family protein n=1 Tax=Thermoanaerobacterium butyriciformans TaxID=1702242 RepID=A0ABS4NGH8_9THEO|nr:MULTISPECIES: hypothetical protein [Thermoanaerobacterium]MBP2072786.1 hypothetical protein [Thermoanaerobacterium butyriciformans]MDK2806049.1 hypothetical protein [Thermoanaerobacterium sp.]WHE08470.1 hypothetical protein PGH24_06990 [Thermoanaerobacterium thermosaccharolyticum]WKV08671.1 hypothetical protein Q2T46_14255 [Thermoanaerobacterium sp. CMT5567-10]